MYMSSRLSSNCAFFVNVMVLVHVNFDVDWCMYVYVLVQFVDTTHVAFLSYFLYIATRVVLYTLEREQNCRKEPLTADFSISSPW